MKAVYSLPVKIAAILLSWILLTAVILGSVGIVLMAEYGFYTDSKESVQRSLLSNQVETDVRSALFDIYDGSYGGSDSLQLTVRGSDSGIIYDDFAGAGYTANFTFEYFKGQFIDAQYEIAAYEAAHSPDVLPENGKDGYTVEYQSETYYYDYDVDTAISETPGIYIIRHTIPYEDVTVDAYVMNVAGSPGRYDILLNLTGMAYDMRISGAVIIGICTIVYIILIIYLCCAAGHVRRDNEIHKNPIDRVPFDVHTVAAAAIVGICIAMVDSTPFGFGSLGNAALWFVLLSIVYFTALNYIMSLATRLKAGGIIKGTLIYRGGRILWKGVKRAAGFAKHIFSSIPGVWQAVLIMCGIAIYELIMISQYEGGYRFFMWVIEYAVLIPLVVLAAVALKKIQTGAKELAGGNIEYRIDTKYMPGSLKSFSMNMNSISSGLTTAVEERMKSERFKTELITNVSHDIKTPLTSIINYVDLIKKEKPENENMRQYIEVLDRQSSRLKKLIEDLVEASKASTGNVPVNMEPCEVGVIIAQTAGEYDEKLKSRQLDLVLNLPEEPCRIMADGRHLWRVLDNLMNNIFKYAQPGTRVYINLEKKNGRVSIVFRNISKYALNISSDELLERFSRGDSSRNTEGSGLGLSIANSLTELQGGTLSLTVDGDLFKVILTFDEI